MQSGSTLPHGADEHFYAVANHGLYDDRLDPRAPGDLVVCRQYGVLVHEIRVDDASVRLV